MSKNPLLLWAPRVLGIAVCLLLAVFALDAVGAQDFLFHLLPMVVLLGIVALSWPGERGWIGGLVFSVLALVYAVRAWHQPSWVATVSGPLLAVGVLFLLSWSRHRPVRAR